MRLLKGEYTNFASYELLEFDYSNQGLTLISGPTGAGKSTLMDAAFWCLFGQTSKDGAVDEVKSWGNINSTFGKQEVDLGDARISVYRIRGKTTQNDLYWVEQSNPDKQIRGKDVTETQKLLEQRLGISAELYFMAAYMHQFSRADGFFVAKAKERRDVLERIADLSLPVSISEGASNSCKTANRDLEGLRIEQGRVEGKISANSATRGIVERSSTTWSNTQRALCNSLEIKASEFEVTKEKELEKVAEKLKELDGKIKPKETLEKELKENEDKQKALEGVRQQFDRVNSAVLSIAAALQLTTKEYQKFSNPKYDICPTCLGSANNSNRELHLAELNTKIQQYGKDQANLLSRKHELMEELELQEHLQDKQKAIVAARHVNETNIAQFAVLGDKYDALETSANTYTKDLEREKATINPYLSQIVSLDKEIDIVTECFMNISMKVIVLEERITHLTQIYDLSFKLRGELLQNVVKGIEGSTNNYLEKYFDGAIRVSFTLDGDKIDVELQKDGNICSFKQLSGGQRCLLKLAFSVSLMKAASDKAGVHFGTLFFDESLSGLDEELKLKAFSLFQELESDHESVILIDHDPGFKSLFTNQYVVSMGGSGSTLEKVGND